MPSQKQVGAAELAHKATAEDQRNMANLGHLVSVLRGLERGVLLTDTPVDEVEKWLHKRVTLLLCASGEGLCD